MTESFKISDIDYLTINQNITLNRLAAQLQKFSNKILCVVNDTTLIFYSRKTHLPKNINFVESKSFNINDIEYYFVNDNDRFTIFGTNEACVFYPPLSKILNIEKEDKIKIIEYVGKEKNIILYHLGNKLKFPFSNKSLLITEKNIFS